MSAAPKPGKPAFPTPQNQAALLRYVDSLDGAAANLIAREGALALFSDGGVEHHMFQIAPDVVNFNIETLLPLIGPRTNDQRDEITDVIYAFLAPYTILAYGLGVAVGKRLGPQPFASSFKGGEK